MTSLTERGGKKEKGKGVTNSQKRNKMIVVIECYKLFDLVKVID